MTRESPHDPESEEALEGSEASSSPKQRKKPEKKERIPISSRYRDFGGGGPLSKRTSLQDMGVIPQIVASQTAETVVGFVIIANFIVVAYETDLRAKTGKPVIEEVETLNFLFLLFYAMEAVVRIYVERWRYFKNGWNNMDFTILVTGILGEILTATSKTSHISLLRVCRLVRLLRSMRLLISFRELWLLIRGLLSAMRTLFWAALLILILCTLWSILTVELIHPKMEEIFGDQDCGRCIRAFASVMEANLTIFGMISGGDDWGAIAYPVIYHEPAFAVVFISLIFVMSFGMLNLITAVIVDTAAQARQEDVEAMAQVKQDEQKRGKRILERIFAEMDEDGSGGITYDELMNGADNCVEFSDTMKVFDLEKEDLKTVFEILDENKSGSASIEEFSDLLWRMKSRDTRTTLMFLRHYVMDIRRKVVDVQKHLVVPNGQLAKSPGAQQKAEVPKKKSLDVASQWPSHKKESLDVANRNRPANTTRQLDAKRPAAVDTGRSKEHKIGLEVDGNGVIDAKGSAFGTSQESGGTFVPCNPNLSIQERMQPMTIHEDVRYSSDAALKEGIQPAMLHANVGHSSDAAWRGNATEFLKEATINSQNWSSKPNGSASHTGSPALDKAHFDDGGQYWQVGTDDDEAKHEQPPSRYVEMLKRA